MRESQGRLGFKPCMRAGVVDRPPQCHHEFAQDLPSVRIPCMANPPRLVALCIAASLAGFIGVAYDATPPNPAPQAVEHPLPDTALDRADYDYRTECAAGRSPGDDPLRCLVLEANVAEAESAQSEGCLSAGWLMSDKSFEEKRTLLDELNASSAKFMVRLDARCGRRMDGDRDDDSRRLRLQCRIDLSREHASLILARAMVVRHGQACWTK